MYDTGVDRTILNVRSSLCIFFETGCFVSWLSALPFPAVPFPAVPYKLLGILLPLPPIFPIGTELEMHLLPCLDLWGRGQILSLCPHTCMASILPREPISLTSSSPYFAGKGEVNLDELFCDKRTGKRRELTEQSQHGGSHISFSSIVWKDVLYGLVLCLQWLAEASICAFMKVME